MTSYLLTQLATRPARAIYVIADIGNAHEGDLKLGRRLVDAAVDAGADAVRLGMTPHPRFRFSAEEWRELAEHLRSRAPHVALVAGICDAADWETARAVRPEAFHVSATALLNLALLDTVAASGKRVYLGVGDAPLSRIEPAVERVARGAGGLGLVVGGEAFPVQAAALKLDRIEKLRRFFDVGVGYRDFSPAGTDEALALCALAVGGGASVVIKGLTHDRSLRWSDHETSLEPAELERFVGLMRRIEVSR